MKLLCKLWNEIKWFSTYIASRILVFFQKIIIAVANIIEEFTGCKTFARNQQIVKMAFTTFFGRILASWNGNKINKKVITINVSLLFKMLREKF